MIATMAKSPMRLPAMTVTVTLSSLRLLPGEKAHEVGGVPEVIGVPEEVLGLVEVEAQEEEVEGLLR